MTSKEKRQRYTRERRGKLLIGHEVATGGIINVYRVYCLKPRGAGEVTLRGGFASKLDAMAFAGSDEAWSLYQQARQEAAPNA